MKIVSASGSVHGLPRRLAPWMPWVRMSRLTRSRLTGVPPPSERQVQLAVAVGLEVLAVHLADDAEELVVAHRARRAPAAGALVVGRARHPERAADELDGEAG